MKEFTEESEQQKDVAGIDFSNFIANHTRDFTGRHWALAEIERWLADPAGPRFFMIIGGPGSGKTALASRLTQVHRIAAHHFCDASRPETVDPRAFLQSIILQLIRSLPGFGPALLQGDGPTIDVSQSVKKIGAGGKVVGIKIGTLDLGKPLPRAQISLSIGSMEPGAMLQSVQVDKVLLPKAPIHEIFRRFLVEPLRRTNPSIPVVIVVDGLDEGLEYRGRETIVDLLANSSDMPSQVRFVLTSRPAVTVLHRIETEQSHQLLLDAGRHENLEDIRHYVNGQLAASEIFRSRLADQRMPTEIFIERITAASGGNFLYVVLLLRSIAAGTHRVDDFEAPPRGLTDTYHEFLRTLIRDHGEQKWRALYRPILGVLAAVQAPVTSEQLGQITGIYHGDVHDALIHLRQLLVISDRRYSLYHSSIVTFLSDQSAAQEFWIDLAPIRVRIAEHEARLVLDELFAKLSTSSRDALKWAENWGRATGAPKLYSTSLLAGLYQDEEGLTHRMLTLAEDASTIRSGLEVLANQTTATNVRMEDITRYGLAQRDVATRIYLSSTYIDLKAERQVVYEALRRLGCDIIAMEDYVATDQRPMERCIADIRAADIYIGVIAWRYGYIPDGYSRSITELEFDAASESRLPRLVFLLDERAPWPEKYVDQDVASIKAFRERVASELAINTFTTSHELATLVSAAVARWQRDHFAHPFEPTEGTEQQAQSGVRQDALHRLPLSDNVQKAVQEALIIANRTGGTSIGPQHLLAGLLALRDALATKWITDLLEVDRESLYRLIAEASEDRMPLDAIRKLLPPYRRLRGHTQDVEALVFSPDGQFLVSGSADCSLRIWNVTTRSERANLLGHTGEVTAVGVTPDGRYVISGSSDHLLQVWDLGTRRPLHGPLMGHTDEVTAVAVTPDGRYVISGSSDHLLQVWDLGTRRPLHGPLMGHTDEVTAVAVTPDGRYVISGSSDHTLQVWDLGTRRPLHGPLMGHTGGVTAVAVTPDGRYVISGSSDHTLQVWDLATGHSLHAPLMGHTGGVTAVAVTPDGGRVISTSLDKTLKVWDLMSGQQISSRNFSGEVGDVALAPDGRTLAVAVDQVVQIWALEQLIAEVHEAEAPHVPAYRLLLATNRPTYTVGERIRVQIELQTATAGSPESFELPTGVGELHCFAASSTGLQVIEPGAASIVVTPGSDQPLVAAIQLQATLPGVRSCSFNFFADDRLIPVNSNISIMVSPPLASGERPSILPTLDVRVAARPEFVLRVELDQPEGDDSSHHLTYRLTSRVPDLQVQNEIVGKVVLHDSDLRRIQTLVRGTVKAAAGLQPEDGRERMISLGRYLYDHLFPTTEAATWREYLRKAEAVWQERRGSGKLPPTWLIIEDEGVWLPWELMVTYRAEEAAQIFWAERYRLSRWVEGLGRPLYGEVPVGDVALAHYKTLQAGEEELDEELNAWRTLLRAAGAEGIINVIKPDTTVYALHILRHMEQLTSQLDIRPKDSVVRTRTPEEETPRAQLDLRAKRPVVTLSILDAPDSSGSEATDGWILPDRVLPFLRAGASAVLGPWWPTCDVADRAFWTNFYDLLEGGVRLGEAVWQARLAVQRELPDRPDWLAYTLFGDPRATPYVPEASAGYATVECLNPDEPLRPGKSYRFRATLGSQPPAWYRDRLVVAEAPHGELRALFLAPDLQTTLPEPVAMHPVSRRLHQATVELTPVASGQYPLLAQILQGDEHLKTLQMSLNVGEKPSSGQANG
jgi:WD40 repeat protein